MQKMVDTKIPLQKCIAMGMHEKMYGDMKGTAGERPMRRESSASDAPVRKPMTSAPEY